MLTCHGGLKTQASKPPWSETGQSGCPASASNRKGRPKHVLKPLLSLGEFAAVLGSCSGDVRQRADRF